MILGLAFFGGCFVLLLFFFKCLQVNIYTYLLWPLGDQRLTSSSKIYSKKSLSCVNEALKCSAITVTGAHTELGGVGVAFLFFTWGAVVSGLAVYGNAVCAMFFIRKLLQYLNPMNGCFRRTSGNYQMKFRRGTNHTRSSSSGLEWNTSSPDVSYHFPQTLHHTGRYQPSEHWNCLSGISFALTENLEHICLGSLRCWVCGSEAGLENRVPMILLDARSIYSDWPDGIAMVVPCCQPGMLWRVGKGQSERWNFRGMQVRLA